MLCFEKQKGIQLGQPLLYEDHRNFWFSCQSIHVPEQVPTHTPWLARVQPGNISHALKLQLLLNELLHLHDLGHASLQ